MAKSKVKVRQKNKSMSVKSKQGDSFGKEAVKMDKIKQLKSKDLENLNVTGTEKLLENVSKVKKQTLLINDKSCEKTVNVKLNELKEGKSSVNEDLKMTKQVKRRLNVDNSIKMDDDENKDEQVSEEKLVKEINERAFKTTKRMLFLRKFKKTISAEYIKSIVKDCVKVNLPFDTKKGFGVIFFLSESAANEAITVLNNAELDGKKILVQQFRFNKLCGSFNDVVLDKIHLLSNQTEDLTEKIKNDLKGVLDVEKKDECKYIVTMKNKDAAMALFRKRCIKIDNSDVFINFYYKYQKKVPTKRMSEMVEGVTAAKKIKINPGDSQQDTEQTELEQKVNDDIGQEEQQQEKIDTGNSQQMKLMFPEKDQKQQDENVEIVGQKKRKKRKKQAKESNSQQGTQQMKSISPEKDQKLQLKESMGQEKQQQQQQQMKSISPEKDHKQQLKESVGQEKQQQQQQMKSISPEKDQKQQLKDSVGQKQQQQMKPISSEEDQKQQDEKIELVGKKKRKKQKKKAKESNSQQGTQEMKSISPEKDQKQQQLKNSVMVAIAKKKHKRKKRSKKNCNV